jgi:uncharacterized protein
MIKKTPETPWPAPPKKQPRTDRGRSSLNTGPDTSLDQPKAAEELYPGWIETYSGVQWNCIAPRPEDVRLGDIAHGLALMCRFGGQVKVPYSVGQHSLYVYHEIQRQYPDDYLIQLHGLLHDASEAYLSDIVRPLKQQVPQYLEIEARTQEAILTGLGITPMTPVGEKVVKAADNAALAAEHRDLYPHSKFDWALPEPPIEDTIVPSSDWEWIERQIIGAFYYLKAMQYRQLINQARDTVCAGF